MPECFHPYSNKQNEICVNPYHYRRIEVAGLLPPVLVPRSNEYPECDRPRLLQALRSPVTYLFDKLHQNAASAGAAAYRPPTMVAPAYYAMDQQQSYGSPVPLPVASPYDEMMDTTDSIPGDDLSQLSSSHSITPSRQQISYNPSSSSAMLQPSMDFSKFFEMPEPDYWCTISYYELNSRVGEIFNVVQTTPIVTIDGFTNPDVNRLCLGRFNNVLRDRNVQKVRDSIGKGIQLRNYNGQIYVSCLSDYAVFVQSANCNYSRGFCRGSICKIPPRQSLKIFDPTEFLQALVTGRSTKEEQVGFAENNAALEGKSKDDIFELEKMCFIRLSFVRGWGAEYQRHNITSTPCWIEIRLNGAFQWYERAIADNPACRLMSSMS